MDKKQTTNEQDFDLSIQTSNKILEILNGMKTYDVLLGITAALVSATLQMKVPLENIQNGIEVYYKIFHSREKEENERAK